MATAARIEQISSHLNHPISENKTEMSSQEVEGKPKIVVHWLNASRAHRIVWLLEELELEYEIKTYQRTSERLAPKELKQVHPLGKSPVVEITFPSGKHIVMAETGAIVDFICEYYDPSHKLSPAPTCPPEEKANWTYWLHYPEGSLMPIILVALIFRFMCAGSPFFIRPIAYALQSGVDAQYIQPELKNHLKFISKYLEENPFFSGKEFGAADIMLSFQILACKRLLGDKKIPQNINDWYERVLERESWKKTVEKVGDLTLDAF